jgi:DNA helicase HerA-like ATPase
MSMHEPVGTAKGPGESPHEYTFVTPDVEERVRHGEFVYYEAVVDGQVRQVVGRITDRRPLRTYPDVFMANPAVPPAHIAQMLGHGQGQHELFEITVRIIGYYDPVLKDFVNPRLPPRAGRPIFLCDDEMLSHILSTRERGKPGSAWIGSLLSREPDAVPIVIDAGAFTSTHLAIIASTGAGKSYLAGVLIEELLKPYNRGCVLVIDPHGEYDTLQEMTNRPEFQGEDGYRPEVKILRPQQVKVRISSLNVGDYRALLPNLTERQEYILRNALSALRRAHGDKYGFDDLMLAVREQGYKPADEMDEIAEEKPTKYADSVEAVLWRLDAVLRHSSSFNDYQQLPLQELYSPGRCTVLQLNEIDAREQQVIVATILRRLLQARVDAERGQADERSEDYIPYPTFTLIEEAHHFAPASGEVVTTHILRQILAEGRKFGVAVGLISQRPGKLDADVLSQCMTQCILRIVNPVDQARVAESIESVGRDLLLELPALSKGQVIIAGSAVNTPVICRVRRRHTSHGAESKDAPSIWVQYSSEGTRKRRERDHALPVELTQPPKPLGSVMLDDDE